MLEKFKAVETNKIYHGDALNTLKQFPDNFVDCVITSPPYWALRDYHVNEQLGREPSFLLYLDNLITIFNQVKRVLKKTGTCWVVMGDTYSGTGHHKKPNPDKKFVDNARNGQVNAANNKIPGIANKCLLLIPSRFALAMIDNGWILRNDIIWHKPNAVPHPVKDRYTVDFEHIFLFTKSKKYYFKQQYEPYKTHENRPAGIIRSREYNYNSKYNGTDLYGTNKMPPIGGIKRANGDNPTYSGNTPPWGKARVARTVWAINTQASNEKHVAMYPEKLVQKIINTIPTPNMLILDPFMGAGTTALVALRNNMQYIGIELNDQFIKIANNRLASRLDHYFQESFNPKSKLATI